MVVMVFLKTSDAIQTFAQWDARGHYLYTTTALSLILGETDNTFQSTIKRLVKARVIERAAHGLYYYAHSRHLGADTIGAVACMIRHGQFCYEGLESAASRWGLISQVPIDRLTVMTTGREGEFATPFGTIEFVHTAAKPAEILANTVGIPGRSLRLASKGYVVRYLVKCRRSLDLIDWEEVGDRG